MIRSALRPTEWTLERTAFVMKLSSLSKRILTNDALGFNWTSVMKRLAVGQSGVGFRGWNGPQLRAKSICCLVEPFQPTRLFPHLSQSDVYIHTQTCTLLARFPSVAVGLPCRLYPAGPGGTNRGHLVLAQPPLRSRWLRCRPSS